MNHPITIDELVEISQRDKWYSIAINPFTHFAAAYALAAYTMAPSTGLFVGMMTVLFSMLIHYVLNWEFFGSNWRVMFRCNVSGKRYAVVKDGARRLRVYALSSDYSAVRDIKSDTPTYDKTFITWLNESTEHVQMTG